MEQEKLKHVCKFCKKRFACGRSLGGHIRCHLPKPGSELKPSTTPPPSSLSSEADTENLRRNKAYQGNCMSNRLCMKGNYSNSSVSEVVEEEHHEEDVDIDIALCLIMLSKDVGPWGGGKDVHGKRSRNIRKRVEKVTSVNGEYLQKGLKMKGIEGFSGSEDVEKGVKMEQVDNKRSKFECATCNKVFHSYQALGGHKASHKKLVEATHCSVTTESNREMKEHIIATEEQSQASKCNDQVVHKHECPICFRVFSSGQALGGHKRSHLLASINNEAKTSHRIADFDVTERSSSSETTRDMLDLNLPPVVHVQEESTSTTITTSMSSNSLVGLIKPHWWVENPHKHEALLSLI